MRKSVLETNQHRRFCTQPFEFKRHGAVAGSKAALDRRDPFNKRQRVFQRNIFAENNERSLFSANIFRWNTRWLLLNGSRRSRAALLPATAPCLLNSKGCVQKRRC